MMVTCEDPTEGMAASFCKECGSSFCCADWKIQRRYPLPSLSDHLNLKLSNWMENGVYKRNPIYSNLNHYCLSLISYFSTSLPMATDSLDFKKALFSIPPSNDQIEEEGKGRGDVASSSSALAAAAMPIPPISTTEKKKEENEVDSKGKKQIDVSTFMNRLVKTKEKLLKTKEQSLMGIVLGNPINLETLVKKLTNDWSFIHGVFEITPNQNNWFEIKFANPIDQKRIWEGRPYHVFGQLLILRPWKSFFDPTQESLTHIDMWIRILKLPKDFLNVEALTAIVEMNQLGKIIRFEPFTARGENLCFPRICILGEVEDIVNKKAIVPDEEGNLHEYPLWCEEVPIGCGFCGDSEHLYPQCTLRLAIMKPMKALNQKKKGKWPLKKGYGRETEMEADGWSQVSRKSNKKSELNEDLEKKAEKVEVNGSKATTPPNDDKKGMEASSSVAPPPNHPEDLEEKKSEELLPEEDYDMEDEENYEEEFTQEEIEKMMKDPEAFEEELTPEELEEMMEDPVDIEGVSEVGLEAAVAASPTSLPSNNSTVRKLKDLEVNNSSLSLSDGGWKRGCDGIEGSATSKLKGGSKNKKIRIS